MKKLLFILAFTFSFSPLRPMDTAPAELLDIESFPVISAEEMTCALCSIGGTDLTSPQAVGCRILGHPYQLLADPFLPYQPYGERDEEHEESEHTVSAPAPNADTSTPLHLAARAGDLEAVKREVLAIKAIRPYKDRPFFAQNLHGNTSLHEAVISGSLGVVAYLLDKLPPAYSSFNLENIEGYTPLHLAILLGHEAMIPLLVKALHDMQIKIAQPSTFGGLLTQITPLHTAAFYGKLEVVRYLHEHGHISIADITMPDLLSGYQPLHWAVATSKPGVVTYLVHQLQHISPTSINAVNHDGYTALHVATLTGNVEIASILIAAGIDVTARTTDNGKTAHELAMALHYTEIARAIKKPIKTKISHFFQKYLAPLG